jgi:hypothetical protein
MGLLIDNMAMLTNNSLIIMIINARTNFRCKVWSLDDQPDKKLGKVIAYIYHA